MAGSAERKQKGAAVESAETEQRAEAETGRRAAADKAQKASEPAKTGSGDSPKPHGDTLEHARNAAAGKPEGT